MKVVLLMLSGNERRARERLATLLPNSSIETVTRSEIQSSGLFAGLKNVRGRDPEVFAIATENLAWQRGQNLFMLFGALSGAHKIVLLDSRDQIQQQSRAAVLLKGLRRVAHESVTSAAVLLSARRELARLENEVKNRSITNVLRNVSGNSNLEITYLRATPGPGNVAGGASSHIKGVVEGLIELGTKVEIISNDKLAGLDENLIKLTVIEPEPLGTTRAAFDVHNNDVFTRGVLAQIEKHKSDFIYQRYARFSWAGVVASLQTKKPLFLEYNGSEVWVGRHWDRVDNLKLLERYERLNLAAATRIFVVSEVDRKNLEQAGVAPQKIIVNANGVNTEVFRPGAGGPVARAELGISNDEKVIGFVGSFGPWHGVQVLAEAIKLIPDELPLKFLLVGTGALQGEMRKLLCAEEQSGRVIFYGGVGHDRVPALLDACDVLVSPHVPLAGGAEFFGSPTKLFEYMAMGKGIVASRLGQIGEVLTHEETALLVEPGNARELSAAITRLVELPELCESLGAAARQVAVERHTWKRNAQNIIDAYYAWQRECPAK